MTHKALTQALENCCEAEQATLTLIGQHSDTIEDGFIRSYVHPIYMQLMQNYESNLTAMTSLNFTAMAEKNYCHFIRVGEKSSETVFQIETG